MMKREALVAVLCGLILVPGCDNDPVPFDAGSDAAVMLLDGGDPDGSLPDGGGDGSVGDDGGMDASGDAGSDAGCTPAACGTFDCGMVDDGCGTLQDCGLCATGAPCTDDADCTSGECATETDSAWFEGYCIEECRHDTDCEGGAHCAFTGDSIFRIGTCLANCGLDSDCRGPEYTCYNLDMDGARECAPVGTGTGVVGDPCTSNADCAGDEDYACLTAGAGYQNGYCTLDCLVDGDCGTGNHCAFIPAAGGEGLCFEDCSTDADCRSPGYACTNADEDTASVTECFRAGTGVGAIGAACTEIYDCAGGPDARCLTPEGSGTFDGYCTILDCATDADCGTGNHCSSFGDGAGGTIGVCQPDCTTDADCRAMGYVCQDADEDSTLECWIGGTGTVAVGDPCEGTWECAGADRAFCFHRPGNDFLDGYCTLGDCTSDGSVPCPAGSHCSIFTDTTTMMPQPDGFCTADCTTNADCRTNAYSCHDMGDIGTSPECWRAADGTGMVGDECRWQNDCAGGDDGICFIDVSNPPGESTGDTVGGYCSIFCGTGGTSCPGGTTCNFGAAFCTLDCAVPLDCPRDEYTCIVPPFTGASMTCWTDLP